MGVNIFYVTKAEKLETEYEVEQLVDKINKKFGRKKFSWCDAFRGPGGYILSMEQAVAVDDRAAPYGIITDGMQWVDTVKPSLTKIWDEPVREIWEPVLKKYGPEYKVLFLKARN